MAELLVSGVVSVRDRQPYVQIASERGNIAQLSMAQARNFAMDILQMCARTEADAMIIKFFEEHEFPPAACGELLIDLCDFRGKLDDEVIETGRTDPDEVQG